ncbi:MAG: hypothetical protein V2A70_10770 [Candidatus Omnitrophota bacterium]
MKRSFLTFLLGITLTIAMVLNAHAQTTSATKLPGRPEKACTPSAGQSCPPASIKSDKYELNIMELTNSQMYRYGREMYLSGNNGEAAKVFLEIIRMDCHNRLAHYHLQKIADRDPAYAFLTKMLRRLPCGTFDFSREDFLPASNYYEKDTNILLEQLLVYHKRQRLSENELKAQAEKYNALVDELESMVAGLASLPGSNISDEEILQRVISGRKIANKFNKEIAYLKSQLMSQRLDQQKELQELRTRLAAGEAELAERESMAPPENAAAAENTPSPKDIAPTPAYSPVAQELMAAVEKAKQELQNKEQLLTEKDHALASLQDRFEDILKRLRIIQENLANKNVQIKTIQTNLQNIQKP